MILSLSYLSKSDLKPVKNNEKHPFLFSYRTCEIKIKNNKLIGKFLKSYCYPGKKKSVNDVPEIYENSHNHYTTSPYMFTPFMTLIILLFIIQSKEYKIS